MKRLLALAAAVLGLVAAVVVARALALGSLQPEAGAVAPIDVDERAALARLSGALRLATVSSPEGPVDPAAFRELHGRLRAWFPRVHAELEVETVGELSLLVTWRGSDPRLAPVLWMAHMDVVAAEAEAAWERPPFSGDVAGGFVWGRGALDDKASLMAMLEAVELSLGEGHRPRRTVLLAFGHDEEVGGRDGARRIAETLRARGVDELAFVLDEGGAITRGLVPGVAAPVALVGIAEKGEVTLTLTARGAGGHASTPPERTSIGILARALTRLEDQPFPLRLGGATRAMLAHLGPELPFRQRLAFANLWLLEPLVVSSIGSTPEGRAMLRTTTAPTVLASGAQTNVLPGSATARVSCRILPGETPESVADRVRAVVADERVEVTGADTGRPPSAVSDPAAPAFRLLARAIRETAGEDVLVAPYLMIAGTDSRWFAELSPHVYRFVPMPLEPDGMRRIHGVDERLAVAGYATCVRFYHRLLRTSDELP